LKKKILVVFGTRPEAIKFAPLINGLREQNDFEVIICITSQHKEMLQQVLYFFEIKVDYDLDLMMPNQDLATLTSAVLSNLSQVFKECRPDLVLVQGDTTTAFAASLAAFYEKIPVAHLEAGLRSHQMYSPFPEEINRKLIASMSSLHFAPTIQAAQHLQQEGITDKVVITGNTVVDALLMGLKILDQSGVTAQMHFPFLDMSKRIILVTGHRRESFGSGFEHICEALRILALRYPDAQILYPVHLNPNVQEPVHRLLGGIGNVHLIQPVSYEKMLLLLQCCYLVLTDSGGVQEEAPSLGKPVVVMRDVTERTEGISAGTALLAGTSTERIVHYVTELMDNSTNYQQMSRSINPYGDGNSSKKIVQIIKDYFEHASS
jgi:UDP-N-acetylglucosamine 2-epimerase (non-hydrolysing)